MLKLIKSLSKRNIVDNVQDASIYSLNPDGTYNVKLRSGAIKRRAINSTEQSFRVGDVVNISMVTGRKETAKIIGKSVTSKGTEKIIQV